ncbi:DUF3558 family protein [Streptomyces sp. JJ38]|uniref:DUF3558 family protein n=1 Tax=Streptomyces sp. JJ38 TaxID=2738128 RepID=UPI001C59148D|nr:DUF3558 family protein [Streptomyces sp. JJ38]MBW1597517.1 DUF3558 family protein [Streptomyces sp. JJ38]
MLHTAPTLRRALALAAIPALLVTGCLGGGDDGKAAESPSPKAESAEPTPEPVKYSTLPDTCKLVPAKLVEELVPEVDHKSGEPLKTSDVATYNGCQWSALEDYDYRTLVVSLRRHESEVGVGSGDERAARYAESQIKKLTGDKSLKGVEQTAVEGVGDEATGIAYEHTSDGDDYRTRTVVARTGNVVVVVDYGGTGFEDGEKPSAKDLGEPAEKAAKQTIAALDKAKDQPKDEAEDKAEDKAEGETEA